MKKLHSLAFYVLVTPAIALGSGALLAAQANTENNSNGNNNSESRDLGEQSMGHDADPEKQSSQQNHETTKSKYNNAQTDQKQGNHSDGQNPDQRMNKARDDLQPAPSHQKLDD